MDSLTLHLLTRTARVGVMGLAWTGAALITTAAGGGVDLGIKAKRNNPFFVRLLLRT
jgi:hypothetical protein